MIALTEERLLVSFSPPLRLFRGWISSLKNEQYLKPIIRIIEQIPPGSFSHVPFSPQNGACPYETHPSATIYSQHSKLLE
jgi:hypothetical protein